MSEARALEFILPGDIDTLTGGYIYARRIVAGLRDRAWRVTVHSLDTSFPSPHQAALADAAATFERLSDGARVVIDGLALGGMPDLVCHHAKRLQIAALIHHPLGLEAGLSSDQQQQFDEAEATALAAVENIIVTSEWTRRLLIERGTEPARCVAVVPGTEPAPLAQGSRGPALNLLCVATLTPRKGHAVLFDALAGLTDRPWQLLCAGTADRDPATALALREQIADLGLQTRISLLGELSQADCARRYAQADVFVLASFLEGYGMVLAEAQARGLPVISTMAGAIPDTVGPDAGILVPPGDRAALANALATVMDDAAARAALSRGARLARETLPDWDQASARFAAALGASV